MNEQHTPGRWQIFNGEDCYLVGASHNCTVARIMHPPVGSALANARRIAACVNALADLPQAALYGGWTRAGLEAYGVRMKAERDELLAALSEFIDEHASHTLTETERLAKARAAIARALPQGAPDA
jgi:hypothetical protein